MSKVSRVAPTGLACIIVMVFSWACTGGTSGTGGGGGGDEVGADAGSNVVPDANQECGEGSPNGPCETCPANSAPVDNSSPLSCECDEGFEFDSSGTQCMAVEVDVCPPNSSPNTENGQMGCRCDDGYVVNAAGNACVLPADACPANSTYFDEDGQSGCRCDDGFIVNSAGNACEPAPTSCPLGNPKATVNGVIVLCCPANAEGVQLSMGTWSCVCAEGESYDALSNQCL